MLCLQLLCVQGHSCSMVPKTPCLPWFMEGCPSHQNSIMYFTAAPCAAFLHTDFMHLAGSLLPALALCWLLECRYGTARVGPLWLAGTAGGAFVSAALGPPCTLVGISPCWHAKLQSPGMPCRQPQ